MDYKNEIESQERKRGFLPSIFALVSFWWSHRPEGAAKVLGKDKGSDARLFPGQPMCGTGPQLRNHSLRSRAVVPQMGRDVSRLGRLPPKTRRPNLPVDKL